MFRASYRGGVALEFPLPPKKSEFLIIVINVNSEQNYFLLLINVQFFYFFV